MTTITVSIDEETLEAVDRLATTLRREARGGAARRHSRSEIVRLALRRLLAEHERRVLEERDRAIFARHRSRLERQARMLVREQAVR